MRKLDSVFLCPCHGRIKHEPSWEPGDNCGHHLSCGSVSKHAGAFESPQLRKRRRPSQKVVATVADVDEETPEMVARRPCLPSCCQRGEEPERETVSHNETVSENEPSEKVKILITKWAQMIDYDNKSGNSFVPGRSRFPSRPASSSRGPCLFSHFIESNSFACRSPLTLPASRL